jgi:hypothetical protein
MAVDDITVVIETNVAAGGTFDRQPSGGVEEMLLSVGAGEVAGTAPNKTLDLRINQVDGTNDESILLEGNDGEQALLWFRAKYLATNTNYFRFTNRGTAQRDMSFAVIAAG